MVYNTHFSELFNKKLLFHATLLHACIIQMYHLCFYLIENIFHKIRVKSDSELTIFFLNYILF